MAKDEKKSETKSETKPETKSKKSSFKFSNVLLSIVLLIVGLMSASYLTTDTIDFGGQLKTVQKLYNKQFVRLLYY